MKKILTFVFLIFLVACQTTKEPQYLTKKEYKVVDIPASLLVCNSLSASDYPDPATMGVKDLNKLVATYETHLGTCVANNKAVKEFISKAKKEIENRK